MDDSHVCSSCDFFKPHFARDDNGQLYELSTGHCANRAMSVVFARKHIKNGTPCMNWHEKVHTEKEINFNETVLERLEQIVKLLKIYNNI